MHIKFWSLFIQIFNLELIRILTTNTRIFKFRPDVAVTENALQLLMVGMQCPHHFQAHLAIHIPSVSVLLNTTLYNAYPGTNIEDTLKKMRAGDADGSLPREFPNEFYNYIRSNLKLLNLYPELKTCYQGVIFGAPSIKIRVSALTATDYTTIRSAGVYTGEIDQETASKTFNPVPPSLKPVPASITKPPAGPTTSVVYLSQSLRPFSSDNSFILTGAEEIFAGPAPSPIHDTINAKICTTVSNPIIPATPDEFQAPRSYPGSKSKPLPVIVTAQEDVESSKSGGGGLLRLQESP